MHWRCRSTLGQLSRFTSLPSPTSNLQENKEVIRTWIILVSGGYRKNGLRNGIHTSKRKAESFCCQTKHHSRNASYVHNDVEDQSRRQKNINQLMYYKLYLILLDFKIFLSDNYPQYIGISLSIQPKFYVSENSRIGILQRFKPQQDNYLY